MLSPNNDVHYAGLLIIHHFDYPVSLCIISAKDQVLLKDTTIALSPLPPSAPLESQPSMH